MDAAGTFLYVLASSSLWLTVSGLALWLGLRSGLRLSPGTRAAASLLVVLQGWLWVGIPIEIDSGWLHANPAAAPSQVAVPVSAPQFLAALPSDSGTYAHVRPAAESVPVSQSQLVTAAEPVLSAQLVRAQRFVPDVLLLAVSVGYASWLAGIAFLLCQSIRGYVALVEMVRALPGARREWQTELTALCDAESIDRPPVLKVGDVASPMLVQTWQSASIVVPACLWQACTKDQRTSILLHELAHYRRGDVWRQLALRLLILPHWFNPVAWWTVRQFGAASEAACDDAACGGDPRVAISYSKALLVLNQRLGAGYAHALAISGGSLTERIRRVLHPEFHKESQMSRFLLLSAMVMLTGLATIRIQAADDSSAAREESEPSASEPGVVLKRRTITEEYEKEKPLEKTESPKTAAGSLLPNGGFEEERDNSNDPEAWFATRVPTTAGHFVLASSSVAHSGQRSVHLEIGDSHPGTLVHYNWTAEAKGWKAGETYELSGWIKTENAKEPAFLMAQCWGEDRNQILGYSESPCYVTGTKDWTRVSTLVKVPEGTRSLRIRAGLTSKDNHGAKAWIDDLALVAVSASAAELNRLQRAKSAPVKNSAPVKSPDGSLLANGGFESVAANSSDPESWFATRVPHAAGHFVLASSSVAHSGQRSAVVEIGDNHPDQKIHYNWTAPVEGWKVGETYELSGWIKTENVKQPAFIMAQFRSEEGPNGMMLGGATTQNAYPVKGTTDWTRVSTRLKVPAGTGAVRIRAGLSSHDNRGAKAWLDDISLVKVVSN